MPQEDVEQQRGSIVPIHLPVDSTVTIEEGHPTIEVFNDKQVASTKSDAQEVSTCQHVLYSTGPFLNLNRVFFITIAFVIQFTAFLCCQTLASQIMRELGFDSLGNINVAVIYLTFSLTSTLAVPIIKTLGARWTLTISSFMYVIWVAAFILPAYKYE